MPAFDVKRLTIEDTVARITKILKKYNIATEVGFSVDKVMVTADELKGDASMLDELADHWEDIASSEEKRSKYSNMSSASKIAKEILANKALEYSLIIEALQDTVTDFEQLTDETEAKLAAVQLKKLLEGYVRQLGQIK